MSANIPGYDGKRLVILGGGFAGLTLARKLAKSEFQIVLVNKHNYHQFQPLLYQVATAGLEPSAIAFPLRKVFQDNQNVHFRKAEIQSVDFDSKVVHTSVGTIHYDYLVNAMGAGTNFFGNKEIQKRSWGLKSIPESLALRNHILMNLERASSIDDEKKRQELLTIVIVGGGPTGVEVAGALAEMRKWIIPRDYHEIDHKKVKIAVVEASGKLLGHMSEKSHKAAEDFLKSLEVEVYNGIAVDSYNGDEVTLSNGEKLPCNTLVWAAGVKGMPVKGIPAELIDKRDRIAVDEFNCIKGQEHEFAIGDIATMQTEKYPHGHPQVAQVAIQQSSLLAKNLLRLEKNVPLKPFRYSDKGTMATVGRNKAVVDLPFYSFRGFWAWLVWMFVHLMAIVGVKNRLLIFINWVWNYVFYDQSLRLIISPAKHPKHKEVPPANQMETSSN
ncbi:NAD(P)/FAD-dependent oxidoreductase [Prolixibacter sp. SD074]|uniref:NAD(P)/FAD-dependent oxidoreductase n=1 Tax=Prolixibacter sp. SD074 TaxID=2652391 RepID=UPI00127298E6|nr:NAD(P)/FAD-dependent oxidoreductase [Prolixibacter sp. SD074]GET28561.1 NADH dehydrogenase [Prolixibacter sp. SD074]